MPRVPMNCPQCGTFLPPGATYCTNCGAVVDPLGKVAKDVGRAGKSVLEATSVALDRAAKAVEPAVDKTVKAVRPAAETAVRVTKEAADKAAKAIGPAVSKGAEAVEKTARRVKDKTRKG